MKTDNKKAFVRDSLAVAAVNFILRFAGIGFNGYLSGKLGAESMGLFTLTMSVYGFAVTLATSGVSLAAVRLSAERYAVAESFEMSKTESCKCLGSVVRSCVLYSLMFSLPVATGLYLIAPTLGERVLCDTRCALSLRALALSLPAISVTSALSGYFTGMRKTHKNALSAIAEQFFKIALTVGLLTLAVPEAFEETEYFCLAVVGSSAFAEGFSLLLNLIMFASDNRAPKGRKNSRSRNTGKSLKTTVKDVSGVAIPVALGAYVRQGLSTAEHISIPRALRQSGRNPDEALASYGTLHGMVFPLVLFPSAIVSSAAGLLVPEFAEMKAKSESSRINRTVVTFTGYVVAFSVACASVFFFFGGEMGLSIYKNGEAGAYITSVAPLVPVMYLDMAVDCMLKGLGEQLTSMRINIIDSACSLALVLLLVPAFGIVGYIVSVFVCETLNCVLSARRLKRVTGVSLRLPFHLMITLSCGGASGAAAKLILNGFGISSPVLAVTLFTALYFSSYSTATRFLKTK